jgi:hypothetical protein
MIRKSNSAMTCLVAPMRLRGCFAVLAIFLGLCAQLVHAHQLSSPTSITTMSRAAIGTPDQDPDTCPLCVAMHSERPSAGAVMSVPAFYALRLPRARLDEPTVSPNVYTYYIRPPPTLDR